MSQEAYTPEVAAKLHAEEIERAIESLCAKFNEALEASGGRGETVVYTRNCKRVVVDAVIAKFSGLGWLVFQLDDGVAIWQSDDLEAQIEAFNAFSITLLQAPRERGFVRRVKYVAFTTDSKVAADAFQLGWKGSGRVVVVDNLWYRSVGVVIIDDGQDVRLNYIDFKRVREVKTKKIW